VSFQHHNLVEHPYPSIVHGIAALDLILCRNVMIYFDWAVIGRVIGRFHECLVDGGWLAVGHAESNTEVFRTYRTVNVTGATIYQKSSDHPTAPSHPVSPALAPTMWQPAAGGQQQWSPPVLPDVPASSRPSPARLPVTPALNGLALVRQLADQGNWTDAARRCELLLDADPLNAAVHFYQALIMEQMNQYGDAELAFRRALYLDRAFLLAHYHLAILLGKTGRRDNAIRSLRNVQGLLSRMDKNQPIADADGLTPDDLGQLIDMQLELWQK
jgi:chemotaxis protein methyltransferase CheR